MESLVEGCDILDGRLHVETEVIVFIICGILFLRFFPLLWVGALMQRQFYLILKVYSIFMRELYERACRQFYLVLVVYTRELVALQWRQQNCFKNFYVAWFSNNFYRDNYSKSTYGMTCFHFTYPWFNHLYFTYLNFNPLPTSVKIRSKNIFYLQFYVYLL